MITALALLLSNRRSEVCPRRQSMGEGVILMNRGFLGALAVSALLSSGSALLASDVGAAGASEPVAYLPTAVNPTYLDTSAPALTTLTPLNYMLSSTSAGKFMTDNNLSVTGFVEGGYLYNFI